MSQGVNILPDDKGNPPQFQLSGSNVPSTIAADGKSFRTMNGALSSGTIQAPTIAASASYTGPAMTCDGLSEAYIGANAALSSSNYGLGFKFSLGPILGGTFSGDDTSAGFSSASATQYQTWSTKVKSDTAQVFIQNADASNALNVSYGYYIR